MILNNIDNLYVGSTNALKVYLGSLLIWALSNDDYDIISTDITSYTGNKSRVYVVDVAKWYMRTVGGNYKEYGIIASSKSSDPYIGELAIDNYHEWEYTETGWVDLGNNSSRLPSDYTELEYVGVRTINSQAPSITLNYYPQEATVIDSKFRPLGEKVVGQLYRAIPNTNTTSFNFIISNGTTSQTTYWRFYPTNVKQAVSNIMNVNTDYVFKSSSSGCWLNKKKIWSRTGKYPSQNTSKLVITNNQSDAYYNLYYFNISENNTALYTLVPSLRNIDGKIGLYDITNNIFYLSDYESTNPYSAGDVLPYPKEYEVLPSPVDVIPTDITSYTGNADRVYVVDVAKWYMRTVGGNYKEYGIYASSKSEDPYVGELAIDNNHEWEYTSNGWVDLGQYSVLPSGYTELTYVNSQYRNSQNAPYIELNYYPNEYTEITSNFKLSGSYFEGALYDVYPSTPQTKFRFSFETLGNSKISFWSFYPITERIVGKVQVNTNYKLYSDDSGAFLNNTRIASRVGVDDEDDPEYVEFVQNTSKLRILWSSSTYQNVNLYSFYVRDYPTVMYNFIPCRRDSDSKIGLYNTIDGNFYLPDNEDTNPFIAGDVLPYPKEYEVLPAPIN